MEDDRERDDRRDDADDTLFSLREWKAARENLKGQPREFIKTIRISDIAFIPMSTRTPY